MLHLMVSRITHTVAVLLLVLSLHMEDPYVVSDSIDILMFPELSLTSSTKSYMIARKWYTLLYSNTLIFCANTTAMITKQHIALMTKQHIVLIVGWGDSANMLYQWLVLLYVTLGPQYQHTTVYEINILVKESDWLSLRLCTQAQHQPNIPADLIQPVQTEFNERFCWVFVVPLPF